MSEWGGPSPSPESLLARILWVSPVAKAAVVETQGADLESLPQTRGRSVAGRRVTRRMCSSNLREKVLFQEQSLPVPFPPELGLGKIAGGDRSSLGICWL